MRCASAGPSSWVGEQGTILHYDGATWTSQPSGTTDSLFDVWGMGPAEVFAVGEPGTILRYDGVTWTPMASGTAAQLRGVAALGTAGLLVVGDETTLLRFGGRVTAPFTDGCPTPTDVYCESVVASATYGQPAVLERPSVDGAREDTGPERFFRFESPVTGRVTVLLTPRGGDLDLVALRGDALGRCDPAADGVTASQGDGADVPESITFDVTTGDVSWLVVDGFAGAAAGFTLEVYCAREPGSGSAGRCGDALPLTCGDRLEGTTLGGPRRLAGYACAGRQDTGPEAVYAYRADTPGPVTATLHAPLGDLDLIVLGAAPNGACRLPACLAASATPDATESVTFEAAAGETYYLVVDGPETPGDDFTLALDCP